MKKRSRGSILALMLACLWISAELQEFAGDYRSEELDTIFRLAVKEGKLFFVHKYASPNAFQSTLPDRFVAGDIALKFERGSDKGITGFALNAGRVRNLRFVKKS